MQVDDASAEIAMSQKRKFLTAFLRLRRSASGGRVKPIYTLSPR